MFFGFPGVKTVANGRAASAPAEQSAIRRTIARKQKKRHFEILLFYRKNYAKRNKLYSFEEEASHQKAENWPPTPQYISENICLNEKFFFVGSTIEWDSNQPNFKLDRTTSFFGVLSFEKLCPKYTLLTLQGHIFLLHLLQT